MLLPIPKKTDSNWKYAFVPGLSPIVGTIVDSALYGILFRTGAGEVISLTAAWSWFIVGFLLLAALLYYARCQQVLHLNHTDHRALKSQAND